MTCDACGSSNTEIEEGHWGQWWICCNECNWVMLYNTYVKDNEPENYGDE